MRYVVGLISTAPSGISRRCCRMAASPYPAYEQIRRFSAVSAQANDAVQPARISDCLTRA
ncbi:hypothetical protein DUU79_20155 [Salmonella enterica subsp. enterica serovar Goldcoast]|uniref:Uncharacterized protein n=1 Tax=Salmonella enterica TaxID=28901 RepID=A0A702WIG8_SALER|nr:hypothetical protein [Salmonella enterica subsp. enterica serovar Vitkin]EAO3648683.1 hypothetical protein [Salmonella enterica]EAP5796133.1 hypothetical protein [Salmonella enterica subsp. enterica serovar Goldcoast]EBH8219976.1 hypothetical protein [Salmonella enterica subsp. enterica serovar Agona str. SL483]EBS6150980.1 hypothetical protein [Salmonella enterica subsp. enterica serovar Inganda]ECD5346418.1 hypothetical protein [Salmonella enterica subsp. enterica serovar Ilala]ECE775063